MKSIVAIAALFAVTGIAPGSAKASQLPPTRIILQSEITRSNIAPEHDELGRVQGGKITVDQGRSKLFLTLQRDFYCPPGVFCAQVMPAPLTIELPLVRTMTDRCGSHTYTAEIDQRPVDGMLRRLEITDNTGNRCPHFVALAPVEASYTTATPGFGSPAVEATSTFEGEVFVVRYPHF